MSIIGVHNKQDFKAPCMEFRLWPFRTPCFWGRGMSVPSLKVNMAMKLKFLMAEN